METYDVIIIGAGFGGLGMARQLIHNSDRTYLILERAGDVGGTWRDNHYPGAACDVPSHLYSYSFRPKSNWSRMFAPWDEIQQYMSDMAHEEGIIDHIRFNQDVKSAVWDNTDHVWVVTTEAGDEFRSRGVISAVGHLSEPKYPAIAGIEDFAGELFHSAAWDDSVSLEGKRIGVIGSGATAIQVVPEVAKVAKHLTVFQRSAPYITPRPDREYTEAEKRMFARVPDAQRAEREDLFWANEERYAQRRGTPALVQQVADTAINHLHSQITDPELREKLTPDYTLGCKRVLKSQDYYPTFNLKHVTLETDPISKIVAGGIETKNGTLHELDVLIVCTGFEATDLPIAYRLFGKDGAPLSDQWSKGMHAYNTITVSNFPNLWIINGPNTGLGHNSAIYIAESQIAYILSSLDYVDSLGDKGAIEVQADAVEEFMDSVDEMAQGTVWLDGGCRSWYVDPRNGRLTTLWPESAYNFRSTNSTFDPSVYNVLTPEVVA